MSSNRLLLIIVTVIVIVAGAVWALRSPTSPAGGAGTTPALSAAIVAPAPAGAPLVTVYKNPSCGCCDAWADEMKAAGYQVEIDDSKDLTQVFREHRIGRELQSCHLATVGDYAIVGHVPVTEVNRLLESGASALGLSVPGMPAGSPGMEVASGRTDLYQVYVIDSAGNGVPLARYRGGVPLD